MEKTIDISKILNAYFLKNRIRKAALARKLNKKSTYIGYLQKRPSIQTQTLLDLCHALQYNFFQDLALLIPKSYATATALECDSKDETIAQLQEEIKILKALCKYIQYTLFFFDIAYIIIIFAKNL